MIEPRQLSRLICIVIAAALSLCAQGQQSGMAVVSGRVIDVDGNPVSGARIALIPLDGGFSGSPPSAFTDEFGKYRLITPPMGRIRLCAVKESAGYPNVQYTLFSTGTEERPIVTVNTATHIDGIDIKLGKPDGIVEADIVDATTHTPVLLAQVTLHRDDRPDALHSSSVRAGHLLFALPPVPIEFKITAPGYLPWTYKDPQTGRDRILLANYDHLKLTIELTKK